jgi:tRNA (guanine-N(7)-)-methyltransferase
MTGDPRKSRATEAFFGRRKGKHLRDAQAAAIAAMLPSIAVDLSKPAPEPLTALWPMPVMRTRLEIGFGAGEHLLYRAASEPDTGFIGVEPFVTSMGKMLVALDEQGLRNVRVYDDDATRVLDWLPDASLDRIDLLYPDPWPKRRHWKRRFVGRVNLDRFARVLKPGGEFCFASDVDTYVNWTLSHLLADPRFEWMARTADDWRKPWAGWPGTRYEAKALREGRTPAYLTFRRL